MDVKRNIKIICFKESSAEFFITIDDEDPKFIKAFLKNGEFNGIYNFPPLLLENTIKEIKDKLSWDKTEISYQTGKETKEDLTNKIVINL